jgi:hypothetical protein
MARSSSTNRPFLHQRSDTGQFSYVRDLQDRIGPLVVGEVQRPWLGTAFLLAGKDVIKISLKMRDAEMARQRWFDVHTQVEPLVQLAVVQARHKSGHAGGRRDLKIVATLSEADRQVLAEQIRHDILADDDRSWIDPQHRNGTAKAVFRAGQGRLSPQAAANKAREIEARVVNYALATRDVGILETPVAEIEDSASAKRMLDRIAAAAEKGEIPDQEDIAALSALSATQVRGSAFDERLAENGIRMPADSLDRRLAALSMLRAAARTHHEVDERLTGRHVATPPRPDPIVVPVTEIAPHSPVLSAVFDTWVRLKRPSAKTKGHNKLYMKRFIALHGIFQSPA